MVAIAIEPPVALVTGASGGIGRWIALGLARAGHHVVLIGRDPARGEAARRWIGEQVTGASTQLQLCDLSLLSQTRTLAKVVLAQHPKIAILVNNAGIFDARRVITAEGHCRVLATNHLSPFVLTEALLPALAAGAPSRIVNIGSSTSDRARLDPDNLELAGRWAMRRAYSQSKLATMMTSFALARRLEGTGVTANVVHPGLVASGLVRSGGVIGAAWRILALWALSEEEGADTPLYAALSPQMAGVSGVYLKDRQAVAPNWRALDPVLQGRVWAATQRLTSPPGGGAPA